MQQGHCGMGEKSDLSVDGSCAACSWIKFPGVCLMLHKWGVPSMWRDGRFFTTSSTIVIVIVSYYENCYCIKLFFVGPFLLRSRKDPTESLFSPLFPHHMQKSLLTHKYICCLSIILQVHHDVIKRKGCKNCRLFFLVFWPFSNLQTLRTG